MKKIDEAAFLPDSEAVNELLDAIIYLMVAVDIKLRKAEEEDYE